MFLLSPKGSQGLSWCQPGPTARSQTRWALQASRGPRQASGNVALKSCPQNRGFRVKAGTGELWSPEGHYTTESSVQGEQESGQRVEPGAWQPRVPCRTSGSPSTPLLENEDGNYLC